MSLFFSLDKAVYQARIAYNFPLICSNPVLFTSSPQPLKNLTLSASVKLSSELILMSLFPNVITLNKVFLAHLILSGAIFALIYQFLENEKGH